MAVASTVLVLQGGRPRSHGAGQRYFYAHMVGGSLLLAGILWHFGETGSLAIEHFDSGPAAWLMFAGVAVNAALVPIHAWLSDAYPEASAVGMVFLGAFTTKTGVYVMPTHVRRLGHTARGRARDGRLRGGVRADGERHPQIAGLPHHQFRGLHGDCGGVWGRRLARHRSPTKCSRTSCGKRRWSWARGPCCTPPARRSSPTSAGARRRCAGCWRRTLRARCPSLCFRCSPAWRQAICTPRHGGGVDLRWAATLLFAASVGTVLAGAVKLPYYAFFAPARDNAAVTDPPPVGHVTPRWARAPCCRSRSECSRARRLTCSACTVEHAAYTTATIVSGLQVLVLSAVGAWLFLPKLAGRDTVTLGRRLGVPQGGASRQRADPAAVGGRCLRSPRPAPPGRCASRLVSSQGRSWGRRG